MFDANVDGGGTQFYGLLDDVAVFTAALTKSDVVTLAQSKHLNGTEAHLLAGYTFGWVPPGGLSAKLSRPLVRTAAAMIVPVSDDRNAIADASRLPLAQTSLMHVPFPPDQAVLVIQGFDSPCVVEPDGKLKCGGHQGNAAFCLDLCHAGVDQSKSDGVPFTAAAPGKVTFVKEDGKSGGQTNFICVRQTALEHSDYLHLKQNTASVDKADQISDGQQLAGVSDTGADVGAYHLHLTVTNLSEAIKGSGGAFVTIPAPLCNYDVSDDGGETWSRVIRGIPKTGQWIRRPLSAGPVRYTAVWKPSNEGEKQGYGWSYEDYRAKYDELWDQGWRLKLLSVYVVGDEVRYTAVWKPSNEGEKQVYGWSYEDYRAKYDELWDQGWRLKLLSVYVVGGNVRYTAVWKPSKEGEKQVYGWSYEDYRAKYDVLWHQGWRLKLLSVYAV